MKKRKDGGRRRTEQIEGRRESPEPVARWRTAFNATGVWWAIKISIRFPRELTQLFHFVLLQRRSSSRSADFRPRRQMTALTSRRNHFVIISFNDAPR